MIPPKLTINACKNATARNTVLSFSQEPLEAGMGGSPWHIVVAMLVSRNLADVKKSKILVAQARMILERLFTQFPTSLHLARAEMYDLVQLLEPLKGGPRRAKALVKFSKAWLKDDWDTVMDLPYVGADVYNALEKYVR